MDETTQDPDQLSSRLLLVALNLTNQKMDEIRTAGFYTYINRDLPDLRECLIKELKRRGDWLDD